MDPIDRPGRRKVTVPLVVLALAVAMAAPVLAAALVVLVVLPVLATIGDGLARRRRAGTGIERTWSERHLPGAIVAPVRFGRNVAVSIVRTSPVIGVAAVVLALWYALGETSLPTAAVDLLLRSIGVCTTGALLLTSWQGSARFRTGLGLDEVVRRAVPDGRTTQRLVVGWLIVAIVVIAAVWLTPDPFPLP